MTHLFIMLIHAIIVYGSSYDILTDCLDSLLAQSKGLDIGVTVVNNTLTPPPDHLLSGDKYQNFVFFHWINNSAPLGYSANNNLALRSNTDKASFALLLNDDVVLLDHALAELLRAIRSNQQIGAVGPTVLNPDGSLQWGKVPFPVGIGGLLQALLGNRVYLWLFGAGTPYFLVGACLLLRTDAINEIGLLDEGFDPGYAEDMDYCWRLNRAGWQVLFCPSASVIHFGGSSFGQRSAKRHQLIFHNLFRFSSKWRPVCEVALLKIAWLIGISVRLILTSVVPRQKFPRLSYLEALKAIIGEILR